MCFVMVCLVLLFSFNSSQAQIWKQVQKAAEQHAVNKASQKVNKQIDKAGEMALSDCSMDEMSGGRGRKQGMSGHRGQDRTRQDKCMTVAGNNWFKVVQRWQPNGLSFFLSAVSMVYL